MLTRRFLWWLPVAMAVGGGAVFLGLRGRSQYCWLEFGSENPLRVLLSANGDSISLTRYEDGRPAGSAHRFAHLDECADVDFDGADRRTRYTVKLIQNLNLPEGADRQLMVWVRINGLIPYEQYCDVALAAERDHARVARFDDMLTVQANTVAYKVPAKLALKRGNKPTDLRVLIGTLDASTGCWVVVRSMNDHGGPSFSEAVHPFAEVEFPAKAGGRPLKRRYPLDEFC